MEVASPGQGANGRPPLPPTPTAIHADLVVQHLVDLLEITLGATTEDLQGKGSILSEGKKEETLQRCTRFASESQVALYVQKDVVTIDLPNGVSNGHSFSGMLRYPCLSKGFV